MPDTTVNPNYIGEFNVFYYQDLDSADGIDLTQSDEDILITDTSWIELCIVDLDVPLNFAEHLFNDRCAAEEEQIAPGRKASSMTFNLNQLRIALADRKAWDALYDSRKVISVLALTEGRSVTTTFGFVGNMQASAATWNQPQEGPNTENYTLRPSARGLKDATGQTVRRVYGSTVP